MLVNTDHHDTSLAQTIFWRFTHKIRTMYKLRPRQEPTPDYLLGAQPNPNGFPRTQSIANSYSFLPCIYRLQKVAAVSTRRRIFILISRKAKGLEQAFNSSCLLLDNQEIRADKGG